MQSVELKGQYSWELLFDIDNSNNEGVISRNETYTTLVHVSRKKFVSELSSTVAKIERSYSVGGKIDVIDVSAKGGASLESISKLQKTDEDSSEFREERTVTTRIEVGPKSRLILYRLVFSGPGITQKLDTLSSTKHALDDVVISCSYNLQKVLKNIKIVYTPDEIMKPEDSIREVDGWTGNINDRNGGEFVWLIPEWTTDWAEGVTGIEVLYQNNKNSNFDDLAKGAGGSYRYLKMVKDRNSRDRITEIKLWRTKDMASKPSRMGWDNWTYDINYGRGGDYLYLCWKITTE